MNIKLTTIAVVSALTLSACATSMPGSNISGQVFKEGQALNPGELSRAVITHIQAVQVEQSADTNAAISTGMGALIGGALGSQVGKGNGKLLATTIGGVSGGVIGNKISGGAALVPGYAISVRFLGGKEISVVQAAEKNTFWQVGEIVTVMHQSNRGDNTYRVMKATQEW